MFKIRFKNLNLKKNNMNSISNLIVSSRKIKNLTQEQLAELSKVNLRTIQRIENNENTPRGNTLKLICDVLEIEIPHTSTENHQAKPQLMEIVFEYFFLILINLVLIAIIGWMTLDSEANINSRIAGFLLSFFIPISIVYLTPKMSKFERILKFGSGFFIYSLSSIIIVGLPTAFVTALLPCLSVSLITLFYGDLIFQKKCD